MSRSLALAQIIDEPVLQLRRDAANDYLDKIKDRIKHISLWHLLQVFTKLLHMKTLVVLNAFVNDLLILKRGISKYNNQREW